MHASLSLTVQGLASRYPELAIACTILIASEAAGGKAHEIFRNGSVHAFWKSDWFLPVQHVDQQVGLTLCTVKPFGFFFCDNWSCENSSVLGGWRLWQVSRMLISCSLGLLSQQRFRIADNEVRPVHHLSNQTGLFGRPKFASGTESASNTWIFVEICLESSTDGLKLSLQ